MQEPDSLLQRRRRFRALIGRFATGVTVVANLWHGHPRAITVNSLASVSLEPLILLFCIRNSSSMLAGFQPAARVSVNVLAGKQEAVCRYHAGQPSQVPLDEAWELLCGCPVLKDALASFVGTVRSSVPCGDHHVVFLEVVEMKEAPEAKDALVFVGGRFTSVALAGAEAGEHKASEMA